MQSPSNKMFKSVLMSKYPLQRLTPLYYTVGDRKWNILPKKLRQKCNSLKHVDVQ